MKAKTKTKAEGNPAAGLHPSPSPSLVPSSRLVSELLASCVISLGAGIDLTPGEINAAVDALVSEREADPMKADFLRALRHKGETPREIAGFAQAMLRRAIDPEIDPARTPGPLLDVCGTGGDRLEMFNVSTTASFVLAAGGAAVVKHGNRAITSRSGGADVLEALGVRIDLPPNELRRCVEDIGIGFLFAPNYHPAFRSIGPVRRALAAEGTSTIFNLLGPLLNPARPEHQLVGVFSAAWTAPFAEVFRELGRRRAWAVHGAGGMDELSLAGASQVSRWEDGATSHGTILPADAGLAPVGVLDELRGGDAAENARLLLGILSGEIGGARRDVVLLNAAAGFVVAGLAADLPAGATRARGAIESGEALRRLEALRAFSSRSGRADDKRPGLR